MPRWIPQSQKMILQSIANDERRPMNEREAARRELAGPVAQSPPSPRRRGRNSTVPQTQEDKDSDVENCFQRDLRDSSSTSSDRREIFLGFDLSTQKLLDVFSRGSRKGPSVAARMTCRRRLPMTGHEACSTKTKPAHGRGQYSEYRRHVS
jgi:hypothetical protein